MISAHPALSLLRSSLRSGDTSSKCAEEMRSISEGRFGESRTRRVRKHPRGESQTAFVHCDRIHFPPPFFIFDLRGETEFSEVISTKSFCEPSNKGFNALYAGGTSSDVRYVATPRGIE